jgi:hypothetical protein
MVPDGSHLTRTYLLDWADGRVRVDEHDGRVDVDITVRFADSWFVVRDGDLPITGSGVDVRGDGLWLTLVDEGAGRWTVGLEAFALAVEDPSDERGERVPLGIDAEYDDGELFGTLLVGSASVELECPASFTAGGG